MEIGVARLWVGATPGAKAGRTEDPRLPGYKFPCQRRLQAGWDQFLALCGRRGPPIELQKSFLHFGGIHHAGGSGQLNIA